MGFFPRVVKIFFKLKKGLFLWGPLKGPRFLDPPTPF